jgi:hypothetical protein
MKIFPKINSYLINNNIILELYGLKKIIKYFIQFLLIMI